MRRRALVTGAARGIGLAVSRRLHRDDIDVVGVDVASPGTDDGRVFAAFHLCDVSDPVAVGALAATTGPVGILVNSAGIVGPNKPTWDVSDDEWRRTLSINLDGVFHASRAYVPHMKSAGWGRIVNIASIAGKEGNPNLAAYSASKAAVIGFTKSLAKELATSGVLVHSVAPAVIATPMNADTAPDVLAYMLSKIPMARAGTADEVAELVAWLASDACSFSTGACYDVSGGRATY
jgi:3-oxoacyl-[acyl-carrier protein] reductase